MVQGHRPAISFEVAAGVSYEIHVKVDGIYRFGISHCLNGPTVTVYPDACWSGCAPVPDDSIHASVGITPGRHRLEHDLMHHLVGLHIYKQETGSPIIWRDAHHIQQTESTTHYRATDGEPYQWGPAQEEEWLVTALTHKLHGKTERDHGAWDWMVSTGYNPESILSDARNILANIPG